MKSTAMAAYKTIMKLPAISAPLGRLLVRLHLTSIWVEVSWKCSDYVTFLHQSLGILNRVAYDYNERKITIGIYSVRRATSEYMWHVMTTHMSTSTE